MLKDEALRQAVDRQIEATLGPSVRPLWSFGPTPQVIAEYRPAGGHGFLVDPRQHAIGLTYAVVLEGEPSPRGEALDFRWFPLDALPGPEESAFGQDIVVLDVLQRIGSQAAV